MATRLYSSLQWPDNWPRSTTRKHAPFDGDRSLSRSVRELHAQVSRITGVDKRSIVITCGDARDPDPGAAVYFASRSAGPVVLACDRWDRTAHNVWALAKHVEAVRGCERWGVGTARQAWAGFTALPPSPDAQPGTVGGGYTPPAPCTRHAWEPVPLAEFEVCRTCGTTRPRPRSHETKPRPARGWRLILGFPWGSRPTAAEIRARHRDLIRQHHPDAGGVDSLVAAAINAARDEALEDCA